jgi:hypothetical protein
MESPAWINWPLRIGRSAADMRRHRHATNPAGVDGTASRRVRPKVRRVDRSPADMRRHRVSLSPARINGTPAWASISWVNRSPTWVAIAGVDGRSDTPAGINGSSRRIVDRRHRCATPRKASLEWNNQSKHRVGSPFAGRYLATRGYFTTETVAITQHLQSSSRLPDLPLSSTAGIRVCTVRSLPFPPFRTRLVVDNTLAVP